MVLIFSYGSNNSKQLSKRLNTRILPGHPASLSGYERIFAGNNEYWKGGVASIYPRKNGKVYGAIFDLTNEQIHILDTQYEHGYKRKKLKVHNELKNIDEECEVYIKNDNTFEKLPSKRYLKAIQILLRENYTYKVA